MVAETKGPKILWAKALFNGLFAWVLGFILYMIPALVVAVKMGIELGPKSDDSAEVSQQISQAISKMYQNSILLFIAFIIVVALLIFWRATVLAKGSGEKRKLNSALVAVFPVVINLLFSFSTGFDVTSVIALLIFVAAGYVGGMLSK